MTAILTPNSRPIHALHLSYTKRWVIAPTHRDQSVAEHSFRVTLIAEALMEALNWSDRDIAIMIQRAIYHDLEECVTGDVPGPQKSKEMGYLKDPFTMIPSECLLKVADSIETGTFWVQWGNADAWWGHPSNNAPRRDIAKVVHYSAAVPGLLLAAQDVWKSITGKEMHIGPR